MKLELGQFYLYRGDTIILYADADYIDEYYYCKAWQGGVLHNLSIRKDSKSLKDFIPIEPAIARMIQSGQAIDTGVV